MVLINAIIPGIHLVPNGHCFHLLESFAHLGPSWKALPPLQLGQLTLLKILLGCHPLCDICKTHRDKSSTCNLPTSTPPSIALCILPGCLFIALLPFLNFELLKAWEPSCFITETIAGPPKGSLSQWVKWRLQCVCKPWPCPLLAVWSEEAT